MNDAAELVLTVCHKNRDIHDFMLFLSDAKDNAHQSVNGF